MDRRLSHILGKKKNRLLHFYKLKLSAENTQTKEDKELQTVLVASCRISKPSQEDNSPFVINHV